MAPAKFASALEASSYQAPGGGTVYAPLRKRMVDLALAMGYDEATMVECGVNWADDQDPVQHVKTHACGHFIIQANFRVFLSFEPYLGREKFDDLMNARRSRGKKIHHRYQTSRQVPRLHVHPAATS